MCITARMVSYTSEASVTAKILQNPGGRCTTVLADIPNKPAFSIIFAPPKPHERDAAEPNIRPNDYLADALPSQSSRIVTGQPEQTVAWPKHGEASCSHGTHHMEPIFMRGISRCNTVRFITCHGTIPMPTS